jgi:hypothetical protein
MLNLIFTADHELYFGMNYYSEEHVLINPTYKLMEVLGHYKIPLTLMTDVCSIFKYNELNIVSNYVSKIEEQLKYAINNDHDVQLHIHPHWLTSCYDGEKWIFNFEYYTLYKLGCNENSKLMTIDELVHKGKEYLDKLLISVCDKYECVAFRAGGWCIQPEKMIFESLLRMGLLIDTTIYKGGYHKILPKYYDFRNVPDIPNWWISPETGINESILKTNGAIFEVVIGSYSRRGVLLWGRKLVNKYERRMLNRNDRVIKGISIDRNGKTNFENYMLKINHFLFQPILLSYDGACKNIMKNIISYYLKKYDCVNNDYYISIIGHPKTLSDVDFEQINKFCKEMKENYSDVINFMKLRDVKEHIDI